MELAPRYCRTCGSRILVKNICHNCNHDPLVGDNYCYDCGALMPNADACLKCGARYKRNSSVKLALIIGSLLIITIAIVGYFLLQTNKPVSVSQQQKPIIQTPPEINKELQITRDTIVNQPIDTTALKITKPADTLVSKIPVPVNTAKKIVTNIFTLEELKSYKTRCTYFGKNQKSQILFFISGGSGYIKMNEKIYELKRKHKGIDVATFANEEFEATIRIDGLSGSAKEWLASCSLMIKDIHLNTIARHKVYSYCIEL